MTEEDLINKLKEEAEKLQSEEIENPTLCLVKNQNRY